MKPQAHFPADPACTPPGRVRGLRNRGFALIVTLMLMILLTVVAIGLLGISSISLRSSGNMSAMAAARANARMGLMIALGQVQSNLGPDQRVTAPADLKNPVAAMPRWVGVYGNKAKASYTDTPSQIDPIPYQPSLLNWLVSGNETVSYVSSTSPVTFGQITTSPTLFPFNPTDAIANLAGTGGTPTIKGLKAALLVGGGSTNSANSAIDYVAAPVVGVKSSGGKINGGYAYWVGDEGVKARFELRDNYRQQTAASEIAKSKAYSFVVSQRSGIEIMRKDQDASVKIGDDYDPAATDNLQKIVSTKQFPLLDPDLASNGVLSHRFHDLTAYSKSVIADSYAGGLKQDMGAAIYGSSGPADTQSLFVPESAAEFGLPTWGQLRSWAKKTAPAATPPPVMPASNVVPQTATGARFGPVILGASLGIGLVTDATAANTLRVKLYPFVVLWNPYNVGIPAKDYEVGFGFRNASDGTDLVNLQLAPASSPGTFTTVGWFSLSGGNPGLSSGTGSELFRFKIQGSEIPAGESHIYLADDPGTGTTMYASGNSPMIRVPSDPPTGIKTRCFDTTKTLTYDPVAYPAGSYFKLAPVIGNAGTMSGDRFEVVVTETGKLASGFNQSTPVYQALLDMNFGGPGLSGSGAPLSSITSFPQIPYLAFRTNLIMGGRGAINSQWMLVGAMHRPGQSKGQQQNRWLANQNPLAPYVKRTAGEKDCVQGAFSHGCVRADQYYVGDDRMFTGITSMGGPGQAHLAGIGGEASNRSPGPLLDVLPTTSTLLSMGQLQHAPLGAYVFGPTYAFGNSNANVEIPRPKQFVAAQLARPGASPINYQDPLYDLPWHLNRTLWDRYYVSTAPSTLTQTEVDQGMPLPNGRMHYVRKGKSPTVDKLRPNSAAALLESAANLMVAGGFNINSTSVDAWRAILTGTNKLTVPADLANPVYSTTPLNSMMPRFSRDVRTTDSNDALGLTNMWGGSGNYNNMFRGNRELALFREVSSGETPAEAQDRLHKVAQNLAEKIVAEIRLRGPFLSLGDFINRRLVESDGDNSTPPTKSSSASSATGIRGTLQAAIDKASIQSASDPVNRQSHFGSSDITNTGAHLDCAMPHWFKEHYAGCPLSETYNGSSPSSGGSDVAMAPKFLTQADVLSTLGPALSARSDTFVVRSYGEALAADGTTVTARAWCEAVVQRFPDYVNSIEAASVAPKSLTSSVNKTFGRRFEIIAFRWLSPQEI